MELTRLMCAIQNKIKVNELEKGTKGEMRKKNKIITFKLINPVFLYAVFIRIGGNKEDAIKFFEKKFEIEASEISARNQNESACLAGSTIFSDGESSHLVWFDSVPGAGIASHEGLHSTIHALTECGLGPIDENNEEAYAYCLQWFLRKLGEKIW